jgi:hypothetical protein
LYHAINGGKDHRVEATGLAVYKVAAVELTANLKGRERTDSEVQRMLTGMAEADLAEIIAATNAVREDLAFLIEQPNVPLPGGVQSKVIATMVQQFVCPSSKAAAKDAILGVLATVANASKAQAEIPQA